MNTFILRENNNNKKRRRLSNLHTCNVLRIIKELHKLKNNMHSCDTHDN
jgi:hypothetical protein